MKKAILSVVSSVLAYTGLTQDIVTISHTNYTTTFCRSLGYPLKVEWELTKDRVDCLVKLNRPPSFTGDPQVFNSDLTRDYLKSGYDKGHNCPDYDNACQTQQILDESFYYTNVMPQPHSSNAGDWEVLEILCRNLAKKGNIVHIWCGGIGSIKKIGKDNVSVPQYTWKVVKTTNKNTIKAYLFNNIDEPQKGPNSHIVPLSKIEQLTGFTFQ